VNELWISNMNGWETIVLDLNTHKTKAYIPTPNGGDTHNGGFVRHTADWKGELLADMCGPKAAVRAIMRDRAASAAKQAAAPAPQPAVAQVGTGQNALALGRTIFEKTAGGVGCASCHGMDGRGIAALGTPEIRGVTEAQVRTALTSVQQMSRITLNDAEIAAVVLYLQQLAKQP
jgi:mono/diheme cytochrome c family protein